MRAALVADLDELDILIADLGLDRPIHPYEIPYYGDSEDERSQQRERVHDRFRREGMLSRTGRLYAEIEDLVHLWAKPDVLLTHIATTIEDGSRFLYRGGWRDRLGVLSHQDGVTVALEELRPAQVIDKMVAALPEWEPIYGTPATFVQPGPREPGLQPARNGDEFFAWPGAAPPAGSGGNGDRFFDAPFLRYGLITCSTREPDTRTRRGRDVDLGSMTWFDTTEGRFFVTAEDLPDGAVRHTITPADRSRIAEWLRDRIDRERDFN
ncbi:ESX secretion-associated protein EspG [Amycolatopsis taiwanensis]|uniref:ESX secretion-associated protein EspG n=1 Tax=Amycolatopsis taiwanensis TaxID=342230 RepID=A0A9W6VER7_9PSEU|nr:ESX secretion-associated protein EspG [Amycolatopsis taiwanensis]GLY68768.1 ESX secretion-associated protein EspG [Amycolatopsis taiwanensis]